MKAIKEEAVAFYLVLLGSKDSSVQGVSVAQLAPLLVKKVPASMQSLLDSPISKEDIKVALFPIGNEKSPGPDGFTAYFFKQAWQVIKVDFIAAIQHYFSSGNMRREVNSTIVTLVPKKPQADHMKDFSPISCCNVVYKCASKVHSNRIKSALSDIISLNHTAFVHGRRIFDNVLLAHELIKKAFDSLSWEFMKAREWRRLKRCIPMLKLGEMFWENL
ncbi:hypothetical protein CRG98_012588 [Punica granatum]|uniref:Reverse transcriptase domain-containing protein n=1 Tax=Punica granatum TaxID=22663 RepID=A0A2I0KFH6_PUNGR|nr:hypothetical protein CRG98_012588 [Punica granatum]